MIDKKLLFFLLVYIKVHGGCCSFAQKIKSYSLLQTMVQNSKDLSMQHQTLNYFSYYINFCETNYVDIEHMQLLLKQHKDYLNLVLLIHTTQAHTTHCPQYKKYGDSFSLFLLSIINKQKDELHWCTKSAP